MEDTDTQTTQTPARWSAGPPEQTAGRPPGFRREIPGSPDRSTHVCPKTLPFPLSTATLQWELRTQGSGEARDDPPSLVSLPVTLQYLRHVEHSRTDWRVGMNLDDTLAKLTSLPVAERLRVVESPWNSIESGTPVSLSPRQRDEIRRRIEAHEATPDELLTWNQVFDRLRIPFSSP